MQEPQLFEYAIIRVVPRVEREEFINVGVILFCKQQKYLKAKYHLNKDKLLALNNQLDCQQIEKNLNAFISIAEGEKSASLIASLDLPSRFRWLTATRSTVIQCSKVHPGFCKTNAGCSLDKIFEEMVL